MNLTMIDLGALSDPARCADEEPAVLEMAQFFAEVPVHLDRRLSSEQIAARTVFIRADTIPGLMPRRPITLAQAAVGVISAAIAGVVLAVAAAALARGIRLVLYKVRFGNPTA